MHDFSFLSEILIFLFAAVCIVPLARLLRSSAVLGYLAAGVLVGPHALGFITDVHRVEILAEFGVVFLLFTIGLELSVERLKVLRRFVFGLGTLQVVISALVIGFAVSLVGVPRDAAIVIGGGLALSSTAFVIQLLIERGELAARFGRVGFSILLLQDLAIVPLLALVPLLGQEDGSIWVALGLAAVKAVIAVAATLVVGRLVLRPLFRMVASAHSPELFVATTLLIVLGVGFGMTLAGVSMALGAFLAGLLLSGTEYRHQVEADIRPFKGLLLGLFFMFVGMSIDLSLVAQYGLQVAIGLVALMSVKGVIIMGLCKAFGLPNDVLVRVGFYLSQGGEFGFVLVGLGMTLGIVDPTVGAVVLAVVALSMAATPLAVFLSNRLAAVLSDKARLAAASLSALDEDTADLGGHVVIAGFGRVGQTVARMLSSQGIIYVALDMNAERVTRCRKQDLPVYFGDASRMEVLEAAGCERASAAVITLDAPGPSTHTVESLRHHFPTLPTYVRARDMKHGARLETVGAKAVVPETVEASLQLGSIVLASVGAGRDDIDALIDSFRSENYAALQNIVESAGEQ